MSKQHFKDTSEVEKLKLELKEQSRQTQIAQQALRDLLQSVEDVKSDNIKLEARILTLKTDNERLRSIAQPARLSSSAESTISWDPAKEGELIRLRAQCTQLREEAETLREKYNKDFTTWKKFAKHYHHHHKDEFTKVRERSVDNGAIAQGGDNDKRALRSPKRRRNSVEGGEVGLEGRVVRSMFSDVVATPASPTSRIAGRRANRDASGAQFYNSLSGGSWPPGTSERRTPTKGGSFGDSGSPESTSTRGSGGRKRKRPGMASSSTAGVSGIRDPDGIASAPPAVRYATYNKGGAEVPIPMDNEGGTSEPANIRQRQYRKRFHAVDCECCHEYYEAVHPVPRQVQPPLWKSPRGTRDCFNNDEQDSIAVHKQQISRHRHIWQPPKTPPKYWSIGFPDTQETKQINKEANELFGQNQGSHSC